MNNLLISDIDSTLLEMSADPTQGVLDAIQRWRDAGNHFTIATGRIYPGAKYLVDSLQVTDFVISSSGAGIYQGHQQVFQKNLPEDVVVKLWNYSNEVGITSQAHSNDRIYTNTKRRLDHYLSIFAKYIKDDYRFPVEVQENIEQVMDRGVQKVSFLLDDPSLYESLVETMEGYDSIRFFRSSDFLFDVINRDASKGEAVNWVREHTSYDQYFTIGDQENDIEMLVAGDFSAAMGNAHPHVKEWADYVTDTCAQDGLAGFIDYLLKKGR